MTTPGSHHMWGNVGYRLSAYYRFMNLVGFTYAEHNPDSWEGWHWGGAHMWGFSHRLGIPEQYDLLEDALKHTEMIVFWSADPETTGGVYGALREHLAPRLAQGAGRQDGLHRPLLQPHRRPVRRQVVRAAPGHRRGPGPRHRLHVAHRGHLRQGVRGRRAPHGFDEWKDYVLGESDGVPKTPEWAEAESGIPAREIRALAREWGAKKTMLAAGGMGGWGGACRAATGNEWARTMIALAAMQGLGKPGSNIWSTTSGAPVRPRPSGSRATPKAASPATSPTPPPASAWPTACGPTAAPSPTRSTPPRARSVPRLRIPEAMSHERLEWRGKGFCGALHRVAVPASTSTRPPGYPHVQMYYRYGGSFIGTMTETNRYVQRLPRGQGAASWSTSPSGSRARPSSPTSSCRPAPTSSAGTSASGRTPPATARTSSTQVQPPGHRARRRSASSRWASRKSDYEIFAALADRLGVGDIYTEGGQTELDWVKRIFHASDLPKRISWEEFEEKGYYVVPVPGGPASPRRRCAGSPKTASKDTPDWGPPPWDTVERQGPADASRARSSSSPPASSASTRPTTCRPGAPGHGPAVHPELGGPPHRRALRQLSRCS